MKFYGKSHEVATAIVDRFETGDVPAALATVFVHRDDNVPCRAWSWNNRFIVAIHGTADARGFNQWKEVGRSVSKGAKAMHILAPCIVAKKASDASEEGDEASRGVLVGFRAVPVFALQSTDVRDPDAWDKANAGNAAEEKRLADLPLRAVADSWGLKVSSYAGRDGSAYGWYRHGEAIALGVENLVVWAHELVHAADDRLGTLTKGRGQKVDNEVVAQLGAAVILTMLGFTRDADLGFTRDYIAGYAGDVEKGARACMQLVDRVCKAVDLILTTAGELAGVPSGAPVGDPDDIGYAAAA